MEHDLCFTISVIIKTHLNRPLSPIHASYHNILHLDTAFWEYVMLTIMNMLSGTCSTIVWTDYRSAIHHCIGVVFKRVLFNVFPCKTFRKHQNLLPNIIANISWFSRNSKSNFYRKCVASYTKQICAWSSPQDVTRVVLLIIMRSGLSFIPGFQFACFAPTNWWIASSLTIIISVWICHVFMRCDSSSC